MINHPSEAPPAEESITGVIVANKLAKSEFMKHDVNHVHAIINILHVQLKTPKDDQLTQLTMTC